MYLYTIRKDVWHKVGKIRRNPLKYSLYDYARELVSVYSQQPEYGAGPALWKVLENGKFEFYSGIPPSEVGGIFIGGYPFKLTMFIVEEI